jgi:hypothetical protein
MFDFPNSPYVGQSVTSPSGAAFVWDGAKWTSAGGGSSGWLFLPTAGGQMSGPLELVDDPVTEIEAATKRYVDMLFAVGVPPGGPYLPTSGGAVTGPLICTIGGSLTNMSLAFGDNATGFYRTGNILVLGVSGTFIGQWLTNMMQLNVPLMMGNQRILAVADATAATDAMNQRSGDARYGSVTATGSTTSRTLADRFADTVNVRDYGAVGDGTTDDTAAFQAAIATGHAIYVPRGWYIVGPLTLAQAMSGAGMGATVLQLRPGTQNIVVVTWTDPGPSTIRDLTIDGASLAAAAIMTPPGLPASGLRIERVEARNCGWTGTSTVQYGIMINWDQTTTNQKQACVVSGCYVHDIVGCGIAASGLGHVISNNTIINCGHSGIDSYGAMIDGVITGNTVNNTGWNLSASSDGITGYDPNNLRVLVIGNTIENSTNHGIHLGGNSIQIVNNKIHTVINGSGIMLQSAPNNAPTPGANGIISGNEIDGVQVGRGIQCGFFSRTVVSGNTVSNIGTTSSYAGIAFIISSDCVCTGNIILNVMNDGIQADTALNLIVNGNRISTVTGRGINDLGASTNMSAFGNIITSEGTPTVPAFAGSPPPWAPLASPTFTGTVTNSGTITGGTVTNATIGTVPSPVTAIVTGGQITQNSAAAINNSFNTTTAQDRTTLVNTNGVLRWRWYWGTGAETGGNAGSNFAINAYDDVGASLGQPMAITRATGVVTLGRGAVLGNAGMPVGFYGVPPVTRQTVGGSRANTEAALANLLTALSNIGIINNTTTA